MTAFVLCSRLNSSRVPMKPLYKYSGRAQISLLISQLMRSGYPIFLAVPDEDVIHYSFLLSEYPKNLTIFSGYPDDPMARMNACAKKYGIKNIIRITHDKIFIDVNKIDLFLNEYEKGYDYVFSSDFIDGTGFEIISSNVLSEATSKFNRVEHISYAIKAVTKKSLNFRFSQFKNDLRLLIDFIEDTKLMEVIFACLGHDITLNEVISFLDKHKAIRSINKLPLVTIYTCAKNASKWIQEAMGSVALQKGFSNYEYILIDDYSDDSTILHMAKFCHTYKNTRFVRNQYNIGLASSSNLALKMSKGKYIIRLDADDFFVNENVIENMVQSIEEQKVDALYPKCYAGIAKKFRTLQNGDENYHCGGALFRTSAINYIKFTDGLRGYDSLDLWARAKDLIGIGLYNKPTFVYRQHNESMSKNDLENRKKIRESIEMKYNLQKAIST